MISFCRPTLFSFNQNFFVEGLGLIGEANNFLFFFQAYRKSENGRN